MARKKKEDTPAEDNPFRKPKPQPDEAGATAHEQPSTVVTSTTANSSDNPFRAAPPAANLPAGRAGSITATMEEGQEEVAERARRSSLCRRFQVFLRIGNGVTGTLSLALSITLIALSAVSIDECEEDCTKLVQQAVAFLIISCFLFLFAMLIILTELHHKIIARYAGFLCRPFGRGAFSIFCGLLQMYIGDAYRASGAIGGSSVQITLLVVGAIGIFFGCLYVFFGSCNCLPNDPLRQEFADYYVAMREYRARQLEPSKREAASKREAQPAEVHVVLEMADDAGKPPAPTGMSSLAAADSGSARGASCRSEQPSASWPPRGDSSRASWHPSDAAPPRDSDFIAT